MSEEFVLGVPDVNASIRGKALRPDVFEAALQHGTVMTDLILGWTRPTRRSPTTRSSGSGPAADLIVQPDPRRFALSVATGLARLPRHPQLARRVGVQARPREVLRKTVGDLVDLGHEVMSAIEYEIRLWIPLGTRCRAASATASRRSGATSGSSMSPSGRWMVSGSSCPPCKPSRARPARAEPRAPTGARHGRRRRAPEVSPSSRSPRRWGCARASSRRRSPARRGSSGTSTCRAGRVSVTSARRDAADPLLTVFSEAVAGGARAHARRLAPAEPDDQPVQATRARMVRADQRHVGLREPLVRSARGALHLAGALAVRVPPTRGRCQPLPALAAPAAGVADGIRRSAKPPQPEEGDAYAPTDVPELPGSLEAALGPSTTTRRTGRRWGRTSASTTSPPPVGAEGLARHGHRLGTGAVRAGGIGDQAGAGSGADQHHVDLLYDLVALVHHPDPHRDDASIGLRARSPDLGDRRQAADRIARVHGRDEAARLLQVDPERPVVGRRRLPAGDRCHEQPMGDRGTVGRAVPYRFGMECSGSWSPVSVAKASMSPAVTVRGRSRPRSRHRCPPGVSAS